VAGHARRAQLGGRKACNCKVHKATTTSRFPTRPRGCWRWSNGVDEDVLFHRAIAEAAQNPFLMSTLDYLAQFLKGATRVTRANEARRADFMDAVRAEHQTIVEAIEKGDAAAARAAAACHMDNAVARIEEADPSFWQSEGVQLAHPLVSRLSVN
jgi:GntR family transcriptional repressor for pyruvate dehydrogenase complex